MQVSSRTENLYTTGPLVFTAGDPVFSAATQGLPLDCQALEDRGLAFLGPTGLTYMGHTGL